MGRKGVIHSTATTGRFDELHIQIANLRSLVTAARQIEMQSSFFAVPDDPVVHMLTGGRNALTQGVLVAQVNIEIDPGRSWPRVGYECPRSM